MGMHMLTVTQIAKICRVSEHTVRGWINTGRLKVYVGTRRVRYIPIDSLMQYLSELSDSRVKTLDWSRIKRSVFTTGQVAKICKVARSTVTKWFDSGRLKGFRIPGTQDRRIPRKNLIRFLKENGMPLGELEGEESHKILLVGTESLFNQRIRELLPESQDYRFEVANSGFEAGILAGSFHPDTIIIDLALGRSEAMQIASNLRKDDEFALTLIISLASEDEAEPEQLLQAGFSKVFKRPFDIADIANFVQEKK